MTITVTSAADVRPVELLLELPRGIAVVEPPGGPAWSWHCGRANRGAHDDGRRPRMGAPRPRESRGARAPGPRGVGVGVRTCDRRGRRACCPTPARSGRVVSPFDTRNDNGNQVARALGEGIEFADVRPSGPVTAPDESTGGSARAVERRTSTISTPNATPKQCCSSTRSPTDRERIARRSTARFAPRARSRPRCSESHDRVGIVSLGGSTDWVDARDGRTGAFRDRRASARERRALDRGRSLAALAPTGRARHLAPSSWCSARSPTIGCCARWSTSAGAASTPPSSSSSRRFLTPGGRFDGATALACWNASFDATRSKRSACGSRGTTADGPLPLRRRRARPRSGAGRDGTTVTTARSVADASSDGARPRAGTGPCRARA